MSTTNRRCKGSLKIIAANQGYKKLLFVPWKVFQEKSLSAEGYLLCFKAALSLDSKWSADFHDKLVCYSICSVEANYGIPRLFKDLPSIMKEIRMQICHRQWLVVASQQGFCDGVKMSRRFHEHNESSLQRLSEDYCSKSRLQEVVICAMEGISRKKSFCRRLFVVFQGGS
jgi:hypothetical protein